jgi:hypothetical protein
MNASRARASRPARASEIEKLGSDNEASRSRDYCVAKYATHRAARPDPSLRKERLLGMTIRLSHDQKLRGLGERRNRWSTEWFRTQDL